jgi:Histidine kinase-like ATPase domain
MPSPPPDAGIDASAAVGDRTFRLELAPEASLVVTARLFASGIARLAGCDEARVDEVKLAVSEACTAALEPRGRHVRIRAVQAPSRLTFGVAPVAVPPSAAADGEATTLPSGVRLIGLLFDDAGPADVDGEPGIGFTVPLDGSPPA